MGEIVDLNKRKKTSFGDNYPLVDPSDIPLGSYKLVQISYKKEELNKFDIILFHRLFKKIYGEPSEIERELQNETLKEEGINRVTIRRFDGSFQILISDIEKLTDEKIMELQNEVISGGIGLEWKYYISVNSGDIIQIGTEDIHNELSIYHRITENQDHPNELAQKESRKFINSLLNEAQRNEGNILNPKREFENGEGVQFYFLRNIYLSNYGSAELTLELSEDLEDILRQELLRYDPRTEDFKDSKKKKHMEKYQSVVGMHYASAILYYFMSLEGFVNHVYHAFLNDEFRDKEFDWERKLSLDQKIRLVSKMCNGLKNEQINPKSDIFINFKKLRDYRNHMFHSKIADSLKTVCFWENGFGYLCDMNKKKQSFPSHKIDLTREDVINAKKIVDDMINKILSIMDEENKKMTNQFIMKKHELPFWKNEEGKIRFGHSQKLTGN